MRYLKEYNGYNDIDAICKEYGIRNYTINQDGSIDVNDNVYLQSKNLYKLPLKFNRVSGNFNCHNNQLNSLVGAPKEVGGYFYGRRNQLTSLEGGPKWVGGDFSCSYNQLTSLKGSPKEVGGDFNCYNNKLITLEGAPKELGGSFDCHDNSLPDLIMYNLKDIKYILKWQDEYSIWKPDGTLDEYKFKQMMQDK